MFASDAKARWAADWVAWKGYDKFWTNLSRDLLPHAQAGEASVEYDSANGDLVVEYRLEGRKVAFLARHGRGHRILPSELNFRANIHGFKQLGVSRIVSVSAVG